MQFFASPKQILSTITPEPSTSCKLSPVTLNDGAFFSSATALATSFATVLATVLATVFATVLAFVVFFTALGLFF